MREIEAAEAKPLVAALKKALRKKDSPDILPAIAALEQRKHESFIKPLIKFLGHRNGRAALAAASALVPRATKEHIKDLWKKGWHHKENRRRYGIRTKVLRCLAQIGHALDDRQFRDVKAEWNWMLKNPKERYGPGLAEICWYFGKMKDKRLALAMAHELDAPETKEEDIGSADNPPTEWWEARWKQWKKMHAACVEALQALTGEKFASVEAAKAWFIKNKETFGVAWYDP